MQYKQHCVTNLAVGTLISAGLGAFDLNWTARMSFAVSFVLATFLLSPDLDLYHSSPARNWGYFRVIWWPYTKVFRHRGWSHFPGIGACTRFAYLALWLALGIFVYEVGLQIYLGSVVEFSQIGDVEFTRAKALLNFAREKEIYCLSILAGVTASDCAHLMVDAVGSFRKKFRI